MWLKANMRIMGTTQQQQSLVHTASLSGLHWIGILAAVVTAAVHLLLGVRMFPSGMGISFILAGLGFLGAIALVLLDYRRRAVYAVGIPFTLVQILLWYVVNFTGSGAKAFPGGIGTLGAVDKVAQVALIVVLVLLLR
jgi:succinate dehydrogenase/fumarate reductase cytochrome b subunit